MVVTDSAIDNRYRTEATRINAAARTRRNILDNCAIVENCTIHDIDPAVVIDSNTCAGGCVVISNDSICQAYDTSARNNYATTTIASSVVPKNCQPSNEDCT